jgi:hypothetical protein
MCDEMNVSDDPSVLRPFIPIVLSVKSVTFRDEMGSGESAAVSHAVIEGLEYETAEDGMMILCRLVDQKLTKVMIPSDVCVIKEKCFCGFGSLREVIFEISIIDVVPISVLLSPSLVFLLGFCFCSFHRIVENPLCFSPYVVLRD